MLSSNLTRASKSGRAKPPIFTNVIRQINAKLRADLYRLNLPNLKDTMVVGIDLINSGTQTTMGLSASYNPSLS